MRSLYPQFVDAGKTTFCGLPHAVISGEQDCMSDADQQFAAIGARLAAIRDGFGGLEQRAWADKHQFGVTQWNNWERGVRRIPVECAEKLCLLYGLSLDFIYLGRRDGLSESAAKVV